MKKTINSYEKVFTQFSAKCGPYQIQAYDLSTSHICYLKRYPCFQRYESALKRQAKDVTFIFSYVFRSYLTDYLIFSGPHKNLVGLLSFTPHLYNGDSLLSIKFCTEVFSENFINVILSTIKPHLNQPFSTMGSYQSIFYPYEFRSPFQNHASVEVLKGGIMVIEQNECAKIKALMQYGFREIKRYSNKITLQYRCSEIA